MLLCPNCRIRLRSNHVQGAVHWDCKLCNGKAAGRDMLRKIDGTGQVEELWQRVSRQPNRMGKACPSCLIPMSAIIAPTANEPVELDFCTRCALLWLDHTEHEALAAAPAAAAEGAPQLSAAHVVLCMIGLPVEHNVRKFNSTPWVTWLVIAVVCATSFLAFDRNGVFWRWSISEGAVNDFAFYPNNPLRGGGYTMFTNFFLHGDIWHLLGNMYFLHLFGNDSEDVLGKFRYVMLLFLATFSGDLMRIFLDPHATMPGVGASGGVAGLISYYLLSFPRARIGVGGWYTLFRPIFIRAWWMLLFFVALEIFHATMQIGGLTNVSGLDHLGGLFMGLIFWIWFKPT